MKVLQINTFYDFGSTGKIAKGIHDVCEKNGIQCVSGYRYREKNSQEYEDTTIVSSWLDCHLHNRFTRYTMLQGWFSYFKTRAFIKKVKKMAPDIIHLHNLHGSYINHKLLFQYIKARNMRVIWTLHDCWSFTGHCPHFDMVGCDKWRTGCQKCPQYKYYTKCYVDNTKLMYKFKKETFGGVKNLTIVTPSKWLAEIAEQSFFKEYPIEVINNGIDLSVFKPTDSDFRKKYNCEDKFILLGVAFGWGTKKGLDVFIELSKRLDDSFQIVLVGTNDSIDAELPDNIISIHRTENQKQLAEIYTAADLFVNPTREEVLGLVNIEALACGTPVVTFDAGGSPECIDSTCGSVVPKDDIDLLYKESLRIKNEQPYTKEMCLKRAKAFDMNDAFEKYVELYKEKYEKLQ